VNDVWSDRAQAYRDSEAHREGRDLDLIVEWAGPGDNRTALDVATGGGHVARRMREAGFQVVTCDPAPGMEPDVICWAEDIPFGESGFDVVTCRVAAHHFADPRAAVAEMARVAGQLVLVSDNLAGGEELEEAEKLRDPSHVRNYSEEEWRGFFETAGLRVDAVEQYEHAIELVGWLERAGCVGKEAERVRELVADRVEGDRVKLSRIVLKGVKS
jgi:SAM-dependent methyltransferase